MNLSDLDLFILALSAMGLGIYLLVRGGDWTIDAAVTIARHYGMSPLLVGFTIVAAGTSFPELIVSVNANFKDSVGIALGNVIGSNIANVLLVVATTAIFAPLVISRLAPVARDLIMMLAASLWLIAALLMGGISLIAGFAMLGALIGYIMLQIHLGRREASQGHHPPQEADIEEPPFSSLKKATGFLLLGLAAIAFGADVLVRGASVAATIIGVPEAVIALSVIAIGTSLPELSTCIIAGLKGKGDIVIGNIIGSNVFNILMILGITAALKPIPQTAIEPQMLSVDMWVMLAASLLMTLSLVFFKKIGRLTGLLALLSYCGYIGYIYLINLL